MEAEGRRVTLLKLGVHVSIAGHIYNAVDRAKDLECNTMQIFSRNPRQRRKTELSLEDIVLFKQKVSAAKINPVIIHIPYVLNLASASKSFYKVTVREFISDLIEADKLGVRYLVTHMGSFKGGTEIGGLKRVTNALNKIIKETVGVKTIVLLENTAGSGSWLGYNFAQIKFVFEGLNSPQRTGVCLDTAHAWAAGYKIDYRKGVDSLVEEIDREIGVERLMAVHLNDTLEDFNSRRDRHFAIGEGKIGRRGLKAILCHPKLKNLPFILETPKLDENDDLKNLKTARKLYKDGILKKN